MTSTRLNGCVKWFDSKKGYGFVKVLGESEEDIFVHFSNIATSGENTYKKLFPGEYISFIRSHNQENGRDECRDVRGVDCGPLMTENTEYRFKVFKNYDVNSPPTEEVTDQGETEEDQ